MKKVNGEVRDISGRWPKLGWVVWASLFAFLLNRSLKDDVLEKGFSGDLSEGTGDILGVTGP